ncbi:hypothetical protein PSQ90_02805 [Devosia rhodophyticola]|uniref:Uncharacterized protein n=1 Tax=Devosia rhodophyticola TaxID=3026423 RepID=A0ABY7YYL0_9HYPH|nr:hypothetical protein [Devosia rhodophyticola]WDR06416.1 hypothetical protein PSQ90_02805 [Devosia rhodophyticola]
MTALLLGAGCVARPTGDFGRAQPSFTHDTAMPAAGKLLAYGRGDAVSQFNQTDIEVEMHDRVWRFLVAEHTSNWFQNTAVELQRTRLTPPLDQNFSEKSYYEWLQRSNFRSAPVRYSAVGADILADTDTVPETFVAICKVIEVDRQRLITRDALSDLEPDVRAGVDARRTENLASIAWFVRALNYRYASYNYALDHLLVETPDERSMDVDAKLADMKNHVDRANRGDFCSQMAGGRANSGFVIPSRYQTMRIDNEVIAIK